MSVFTGFDINSSLSTTNICHEVYHLNIAWFKSPQHAPVLVCIDVAMFLALLCSHCLLNSYMLPQMTLQTYPIDFSGTNIDNRPFRGARTPTENTTDAQMIVLTVLIY